MISTQKKTKIIYHIIIATVCQCMIKLRFPATVVIALQLAMLCSLQYPSEIEDSEMDGIEAMIQRTLELIYCYSLVKCYVLVFLVVTKT